MKIGINVMPVPAPELAAIGQRVEALGFEGLYYGEHIAVPLRLKTPYPGKIGYHGKVTQLECYVALGHLAAVTRRVRLATGLSVLPIRHPLQTARAITTVDNLSGGRFDLIVGLGSIPDEYEAMNVDYRTRGARLDEWLDILDKLWRQDEIEHHGRFMDFEAIGFEPKPVQRPGPPLYLCAYTAVGFERAARRATGWYGDINSPAKLREVIAEFTPILEKHGRDPASFKYKLIHAAGVDDLPSREELADYADAGADCIVVSPFELEERAAAEKLERVAEAFRPYLTP